MTSNQRARLIDETTFNLEWTIRQLESMLDHLEQLQAQLVSLGVVYDPEMPGDWSHLRRRLAAFAA